MVEYIRREVLVTRGYRSILPPSIKAESRAMGELDHPDSSVVNLQNVSHNIKEMHWLKVMIYLGTVEVLGTPSW